MKPLPRHTAGGPLARLVLRFRRALRYHRIHLIYRARDPHLTSLSFAIGVFLGCMPISSLATALCLLLPRLFKLRAIPAVIGSLVGNPLTTPIIYSAGFFFGQFLTTGSFGAWKDKLPPAGSTLRETMLAYLSLGPPFFLGIVFVSFLAALAGYFLVVESVSSYQSLRRMHVLERLREKEKAAVERLLRKRAHKAHPGGFGVEPEPRDAEDRGAASRGEAPPTDAPPPGRDDHGQKESSSPPGEEAAQPGPLADAVAPSQPENAERETTRTPGNPNRRPTT